MACSVLAVIVSYNPEILLLKRLVSQLCEQLCEVLIVDNGSEKTEELEALNLEYNINIIFLKQNLGIAVAQNLGLKEAIQSKFDYVIIFDQDSSINATFIYDLICTYTNLSQLDSNIATVGPTFIDTKTKKKSLGVRYKGLSFSSVPPKFGELAIKSDYIISSGSLINPKTLEHIGLMDEKLFIDFVDIEWGIRAKQKGYNSYMSNEVFMDHTIGNFSKKIPLINRFINIHSDFRKYFIVRNSIYLMLYSTLPLNWKIIQFAKTIFYMTTIFFASSNKISILKKYLLAIKDAVFRKMYKGSM